MRKKATRWYDDIATSILERDSDVVPHDKLIPVKRGICLILLPQHYFFRYVLFSRSGSKDHFNFGHGITPLYEATNEFGQPYCDDIVDPFTGHLGGFSVDNPNLLDVVGRSLPKVMKILRRVENPDDFSFYLKAYTWSMSDKDHGEAWARAAAGDFAASTKLVTLQIERFRWNKTGDHPRLQMEDFQGLLRLDAALKQGQDAVLTVLRDNERRNVEKFKLEKYWQPTPFPFEMRG